MPRKATLGFEPLSTSTDAGPAAPGDGGEVGCAPGPTLTLPEAIDTAFRLQPRLRVYLESVAQARGAEGIAFAPFLPTAVAGYSVGEFRLNAGGASVPVGPLPGFTFIPFQGTVPIGLDVSPSYELAELKLQWLLCDFGRRLGRYCQASIGVDIAQLQTQRAYQAVANDVSVAYYQILRTIALRKIAQEAVRRSEEDLEVTRKLAKRGVLEREKVLRAEVQLATSQRLLDAASGAETVAAAALNLAIGLNVNARITPAPLPQSSPDGKKDESAAAEGDNVPPFTQSLAECLQTAVARRREFQVARAGIQVADEGRRVARADFAPRIVAEGALFDFQQADPRGHADLPLGFIKMEWGLFEGGKRVAELHVADSKLRAAMAQAETVADTIAFEVTEAYTRLVTARQGIERSRPAVAQAEENYRLVKARARQGDATPSEIVDAESTLTRAQEEHITSIHDYLIALARLEYAMGVTATPDSLYCHRPGNPS
jgi:outer membrane protein TolC